MIQNLGENLRRARRRLEEIPEISLLKDWTWDATVRCFYLNISICLECCSPEIPQRTEWYVTATQLYPFGALGIYPSCKNSITNTFPHQSCNALIEENGLWRKGKLCLSLINRTLGIHAPEKEPFTVDERLFWNAQRAVLWLYTAAKDELMKDGDFFELPEFPLSSAKLTFAFQEDSVSMMMWEDSEERYGIAKIRRKKLNSDSSVAIIHGFYSIDSYRVYQPAWGTDVESIKTEEYALWVRLNKIPVINDWQAPINLLELKNICTSQGVDLLEIIKIFAPKARDGLSHLLLIGFPVPEHVGESPCEIVWQAIELPVLTCGKYTNQEFHPGKRNSIPHTKGAKKGFRPNEAGWWMNDKETILRDSMTLSWIPSENWSGRTIKERGRLAGGLISRRIALIGLGSLGSLIAELLARAGAVHLTCIDGGSLEIGNLCRHTLCVPNLYQNKSEAVAKRLSEIDPNVHTNYCNEYLSVDKSGTVTPELNNYDIIVDTTGEDKVLTLLSSVRCKKNTVFCSSSVGLGAKRLYINMQKVCQPCFESFLEYVGPYLKRDLEDCNLDEFPRDGIGCWHPAFPARADDMWLAACATVKALESFIRQEGDRVSLIYETQGDEGQFAGFRLIGERYENR